MSPYIPPVVRFDQVRPAPMRWLWKPYLARGKLAILDGDAGVGKSFFTADLADAAARARLGTAARAFVQRQQGATGRTVELLAALIQARRSRPTAA